VRLRWQIKKAFGSRARTSHACIGDDHFLSWLVFPIDDVAAAEVFYIRKLKPRLNVQRLIIKDGRFEIRLSRSEKDAWRAAARAAGVSMAEWINSLCNEACRGANPQKPAKQAVAPKPAWEE
jgi:hypothetical protein